MFLKNHRSLYEGDALELLWPKVAKSIWKSVIEYVSRNDLVPTIIIRCRAVPESSLPMKQLVTNY